MKRTTAARQGTTPKQLAEQTDDKLVVAPHTLPADVAQASEEAAAKVPALLRVVDLVELLFNVNPNWDNILRERALTSHEKYEDLVQKVKVATLAACWPDLFHITEAGEGENKVYELLPNDGKEYATRLDLLDDAGETLAVLDGKRAILLAVDTVVGNAPEFTNAPGSGEDYASAPARKGRAIVVEGYAQLALPTLAPRTNRMALLIRLL